MFYSVAIAIQFCRTYSNVPLLRTPLIETIALQRKKTSTSGDNFSSCASEYDPAAFVFALRFGLRRTRESDRSFTEVSMHHSNV